MNGYVKPHGIKSTIATPSTAAISNTSLDRNDWHRIRCSESNETNSTSKTLESSPTKQHNFAATVKPKSSILPGPNDSLFMRQLSSTVASLMVQWDQLPSSTTSSISSDAVQFEAQQFNEWREETSRALSKVQDLLPVIAFGRLPKPTSTPSISPSKSSSIPSLSSSIPSLSPSITSLSPSLPLLSPSITPLPLRTSPPSYRPQDLPQFLSQRAPFPQRIAKSVPTDTPTESRPPSPSTNSSIRRRVPLDLVFGAKQTSTFSRERDSSDEEPVEILASPSFGTEAEANHNLDHSSSFKTSRQEAQESSWIAILDSIEDIYKACMGSESDSDDGTEKSRQNAGDRIVFCTLCSRGLLRENVPTHLSSCTRKLSYKNFKTHNASTPAGQTSTAARLISPHSHASIRADGVGHVRRRSVSGRQNGLDSQGYPTLVAHSHHRRRSSGTMGLQIFVSSSSLGRQPSLNGVPSRLSAQNMVRFHIKTKVDGRFYMTSRSRNEFIKLHTSIWSHLTSLPMSHEHQEHLIFFNNLQWTPSIVLSTDEAHEEEQQETGETETSGRNSHRGGGPQTMDRVISSVQKLFKNKTFGDMNDPVDPVIPTRKPPTMGLRGNKGIWKIDDVQRYLRSLCMRSFFRTLDVVTAFLNIYE